MPVQREQDGKEQLPPEMCRHKAQVAIGRGQCQRRLPIFVEIGKQRIAGELVHIQHPRSAEDRKADHAGKAAGQQPHRLMFPAAAQRHQRGGEADAERHLRQLETHRHAGDQAGGACDHCRLAQRAAGQRVAFQDQDGQTRQHEHAHHIVVIGGAELGQGQRPHQPQQRQRAGHDLDVGYRQIRPDRHARSQGGPWRARQTDRSDRAPKPSCRRRAHCHRRQ